MDRESLSQIAWVASFKVITQVTISILSKAVSFAKPKTFAETAYGPSTLLLAIDWRRRVGLHERTGATATPRCFIDQLLDEYHWHFGRFYSE